MLPSVLYCGDTDLSSAAAYLAGMMTDWGWTFDYVPSHRPLSAVEAVRTRALYVFSDYPAANASAEAQDRIVEAVQDGAGLLMIGGWESFHGQGGNWDGTPIGDALPVVIAPTDDRINFDQGALLRCVENETTEDRLPWHNRPPQIGGMNRFEPKPDSKLILQAHPLRAEVRGDGALHIAAEAPRAALVYGTCGRGRTAAYASDVAPHWCGGFVDWGDARVTAQAPGAAAIEVGNWYAEFWKQVLMRTMRASV